MCFFSATLHSPAIRNLSDKICCNPTWVDLKGVDSVPDTVHHVICNIDIKKHIRYLINTRVNSLTDNVHGDDIINYIKSVIHTKNIDDTEMLVKLLHSKNSVMTVDIKSQLIKELKQQLCLQIVDKFNMSQCMIFCRTNVDCDNLEAFFCKLGGINNSKKFSEKTETGKENPYSCCVLGGMRTMEERRRSLDAFKSGR